MLKNESAWNSTKPTPLRPARLLDSDGIIFMSNGVRMKKISRFDHQVKQGKIWDADCTCPYSPYSHVEGRTLMVTWQFDDVMCLYWMVVAQWSVDTCPFLVGLYGYIYVK